MLLHASDTPLGEPVQQERKRLGGYFHGIHTLELTTQQQEGLNKHFEQLCERSYLANFLPENEVAHRSNADRDAFFNTLGECFTREEVMAKAAELKIKKDTVNSWITRLLKKKMLVKSDNNRGYMSVCIKKIQKKTLLLVINSFFSIISRM